MVKIPRVSIQSRADSGPALKNMGDEFIRGYIRLAEGEKDPRNLLLAFAIDRVLLIEFNVVNWIEVSQFERPDGDT